MSYHYQRVLTGLEESSNDSLNARWVSRQVAVDPVGHCCTRVFLSELKAAADANAEAARAAHAQPNAAQNPFLAQNPYFTDPAVLQMQVGLQE